MKNKNLLMVAFMVTAFLLSGLTAMAQDEAPKAEPHKDMMEQLGITEEQKTELASLRVEQQKQTIDLSAQLKKAHLELGQLMKGHGNDDAVVAKHAEVTAVTGKLQALKLQQQLATRAIFTPEQWKKVGPRFSRMGSERGHQRSSDRKFSRGGRRGNTRMSMNRQMRTRTPRSPRSPRTQRAHR